MGAVPFDKQCHIRDWQPPFSVRCERKATHEYGGQPCCEFHYGARVEEAREKASAAAQAAVIEAAKAWRAADENSDADGIRVTLALIAAVDALASLSPARGSRL